MNTEYDIIIVGSGMGGLVSAVILAKEGLRVCVLEKNNQYGGCLQTFAREKSIFDTGVHYIGSLDEGENLHQYFKYLGILDDLRLSKMEEKFDYITFEGDEIQYPYTQGYDNFVRELESFFPEEKEAIAKYAATLQKVCLAFPLYNLHQDEDAYNQEY
ncbi:MAG TPA: NAD(P)-binding protein, partial [Flavobacterium sp.]|nr:NAD(P)-binding protein [Flavobacterium sp.]